MVLLVSVPLRSGSISTSDHCNIANITYLHLDIVAWRESPRPAVLQSPT